MASAAPSPIDGLTERERACVELLASGKTVRETARCIGVSEKTIWNYRQRRHVQEAVFRRQTETFDRTGSQGLSLLPEVVEALRSIVRGVNSKGQPVLRDNRDVIAASRVLISSANEYQARRQLERQIADLEARIFGDLRPTIPVPMEQHGARPAPPPPEDDDEDTDTIVDVDAALGMLSELSPGARQALQAARPQPAPPEAAEPPAAPDPPPRPKAGRPRASRPVLTAETPLQRKVRERRERATAEAAGEVYE